MFIGTVLQRRMDMLGLSSCELANDSLLDEAFIKKILKDELPVDKIDNFDLSVLSNALYCTPEYFMDESVRNQDALLSSVNRGEDTQKSNLAKAKLQSFMRDFTWLNNTID